jgi:hypothetical protein
MKSFLIMSITKKGREALDRTLKYRDINILIPLALKKCGAKRDIDYFIEVIKDEDAL